MADLCLWLEAVLFNWVGGMSALFGLVLSYLGWFVIPDTAHLQPYVKAVGILALVWAVYRAWKREHQLRSDAEVKLNDDTWLRNGPDILIEFTHGEGPLFFRNIGQETAMNVFLDLPDTTDIELDFQTGARTIPAIDPNSPRECVILTHKRLSVDIGETTSLYNFIKTHQPVQVSVAFKNPRGRAARRRFTAESGSGRVEFHPNAIEVLQ